MRGQTVSLVMVCGAAALWPMSMLAQSAQTPASAAADTAAVMKADADFAKSVAEKDRAKFLSFVADRTTFNGGSDGEIRGRDAVMKQWDAFFAPDGPTLTWAPTSGGVIETGDVGYTMGSSILRRKGADGKMVETHGRYLTVWRKQADGSWQAVFDTGSTLPAR